MTVSPRPDVALLAGYHSPQVHVDVRLNTNESPYPPPEAWFDEVTDLVRTIAWHRYPDREAGELRRAIGALHGVGPEHVFVANGSNEVLQTLLLAYGGAGRRALVWEPTYALHGHIARLTGTEVIVGERDEDFALDRDAAVALVAEARPAVTFLCSPNNPTGLVEDDAVVGDLVAHVPGLLVVDEAYGQFAPRSYVDWPADGHDHVVVTRTFSKTWSMAAARLGYAIAAPAVVEQLHKVVLPYHLDAFKQAAATLALRHVDEMNARVAQLVEGRGHLEAGLGSLPVTYWPSGANFVLFRPHALSGEELWQRLLDRSILVRNCSSWPGLADCLRVTVGTPRENDIFLDALEDILR